MLQKIRDKSSGPATLEWCSLKAGCSLNNCGIKFKLLICDWHPVQSYSSE